MSSNYEEDSARALEDLRCLLEVLLAEASDTPTRDELRTLYQKADGKVREWVENRTRVLGPETDRRFVCLRVNSLTQISATFKPEEVEFSIAVDDDGKIRTWAVIFGNPEETSCFVLSSREFSSDTLC